MQKRVHIVASGRVQGVGYRAAIYQKAVELGIKGWVRNLADGSVEILAEGEKTGIAAFVGWCEKGPRWASVDKLQVTGQPAGSEFSEFSIRRDG